MGAVAFGISKTNLLPALFYVLIHFSWNFSFNCSVSDPYSLNPDPDPAKNLNPDPYPSYFKTI